ncbi:MAG: GNAT family N-acetyltransferase [Saprospirales bacterium]|nr:GNAT family N-acetyltransferase [Saprospirales bacterium]MBK8921260.1 GNAT family N-acetyltransferase [Saprospirales bacterium]
MNNPDVQLRIRRVAAEEAGELCRFAEQTFRAAWQHDNDPEPFEAYCLDAFALKKIQEEMQAPGAEFYFAFLGETLAAYLKLRINHSPAHGELRGSALQLERIYVDAARQSRGLGADLLDFVEQRARDTGASWVWLSVWQKAPRSLAFYERNGYDIFGVETFWVGNDPQPDWLVRKGVT